MANRWMFRVCVALALVVGAPARATVSSTGTVTSYVCSGRTAYVVPFKFLSSTHLVVTVTSTAGLTSTLALTSDYSVTGAGQATGTVILASSAKCATGATLTIKRAVPLTQGASLSTQGPFNPKAVEAALDASVLQAQELAAAHAADKAAQVLKDAAQDAAYAAVNPGNVSTAHNTGWINVQEAPYSAKCDGTTDDAPALSAAQLASFGTTIVIPCRLKIASPVGVTSISNQNFGIGNGSQTVFPLGTSVTSATITQAGGDWQGTRTMYATPRTNLITYSDQADNAAWVKGNATVTANSVAAPDGTTTADTFTDTGTNAQHSLLQSATVVAGSTVVASRYVKAGTSSWAVIHTGAHSAKYDLSGGVASLRSGTCTFGMTSVGSGWWRIWISWTEAGTSASPTLYLSTDGTTISFAGTGLSLYTWRAQTEVGATTPTTSIQTTATAASVTDYALTAAGIVTFAAAPNSGALLSFSSSYTQSITSPLRFEGAGRLVTYPGASVTLAGPVLAGASQIFDTTGGGTLTFAAAVPWVYPEWWGAKGDGVTDDTLPLQASIDAGYGRVVRLRRADYRYSGTLVIDPLKKLPITIHGDGFDSISGGGTALRNVGTGNGIEIINGSSNSNADQLTVLSGFALIGDGANASGGHGIKAQRVNNLNLRDLWVQDQRESGIYLKDCWLSTVENATLLNNRRHGIYIDRQFNGGVIRRVRAYGNGRVYDASHASIFITGGTGAESHGARIEATDVSYAGGAAFSHWERCPSDGGGGCLPATLTSIVVAGAVTTVTTSTPHGLAVGNKFTVNGATVAPGLNTQYTFTIASTPTGTTFTFATPGGVANGTYTESSLKIRPSSFGILANDTQGLVIASGYAEDTADNAVYIGSNSVGTEISGGFFLNQLLTVDGFNARIGGARFAGIAGGVAVGQPGRHEVDVLGSNSFEAGTRQSYPDPRKVDGRYVGSGPPSSGTWLRGDVVWGVAPAAGGIPGWMCVTAGSPGTWKAMSSLAP